MHLNPAHQSVKSCVRYLCVCHLLMNYRQLSDYFFCTFSLYTSRIALTTSSIPISEESTSTASSACFRGEISRFMSRSSRSMMSFRIWSRSKDSPFCSYSSALLFALVSGSVVFAGHRGFFVGGIEGRQRKEASVRAGTPSGDTTRAP